MPYVFYTDYPEKLLELFVTGLCLVNEIPMIILIYFSSYLMSYLLFDLIKLNCIRLDWIKINFAGIKQSTSEHSTASAKQQVALSVKYKRNNVFKFSVCCLVVSCY